MLRGVASIYESIGGADAVSAAVDDFYGRVLSDPELAPFFVDSDQRKLRAHQRAFLTAALGGPAAYEGKKMSDAHAGRGIEDRHFDLVAGHLSGTLTHLGVDDATVGTIIGVVAGLRPEVVAAS
jgi:hemoglobin